MKTILELVKKEKPCFYGCRLTLDDVEFISPLDDKLLFYMGDDFDFKVKNGILGKGIYFSNALSKVIEQSPKNQTLFTIMGCKVISNMKVDNYKMITDESISEYCIYDAQHIIPCCVIYMSIRNY